MGGLHLWAEAATRLEVPFGAAAPFTILLLAIAVLPLIYEHWWHSNRNKGIVVAALSIPTMIYILTFGEEGTQRLLHELEAYASFIILLLALYTISGGVLVRGDIPAHPITNTGILAFGAVLANFVGTTGASMLLIRPILRINSEREHKSHVPIFFIFIVSNTGGLLTPLGDPPLFLGFLKGVDFFWTLRLWFPWLLVNVAVLVVFYIYDNISYSKESAKAIQDDETQVTPLTVIGLRANVLLLIGVLLAVVFQSEQAGKGLGALFGGLDLTLHKPMGEILMLVMTGLSLYLTPRGLRKENDFTWAPIIEVAVIFIGIFITMVPALALLEIHGASFGITKPYQFFWLTGMLSSFLDNAPTYVTFGTLAADGNGFQWLSLNKPELLAAISCGAVFMGALTYIGNGPNFMVKAIAENSGYKMPTFFAYMGYSFAILVPLFIALTFVFFKVM